MTDRDTDSPESGSLPSELPGQAPTAPLSGAGHASHPSRDGQLDGARDTFGLTPRPKNKAHVVDPLLGMDLGGVRIVRLIGEGGMGRVYEARQDRPDRAVAVKVIRQGITSEKTMRRFEREAEFLGKLQHPGIAQIFLVGTYSSDLGDVPFYVMEFITDAKPITGYARENQLPLESKLELFRQVCLAVAHGHDRGIIHRDLKPGNVLIGTSGQPKVIDFGVARSTDSDLALTSMKTESGQLVGTLPYMCPEQFGANPNDLDARADVYSLGVMLYELIVGELPYDVSSKGLHEAARIVCEEKPVPLGARERSVPKAVSLVADRCLAKDKRDRYATAGELASDIDRVLSGRPIARRVPRGLLDMATRSWLPGKGAGRRNLVVSLSLAAIGLGIGVSPGVGLFDLEQDRTTTQEVSDTWTESGLNVRKDHCYRLQVTGTFTDATGITFGPEGTAPARYHDQLGPAADMSPAARAEVFVGQHPRRAVIAMIGDKAWSIHVGAALTFVAPDSGQISLRINEPAKSTLSPSGEATLSLNRVRNPVLLDADGTMTVRARIDDSDFLLVRPEGLQWEYGGAWSRVGLHDGMYPTLINGVAWWPDWPDPIWSSILRIPAIGRVFVSPGRRPTVEVVSVTAAAGEVHVDDTRANGVAVRFRDTGLGSSEVACTLRLLPAEPPPAGRP